MFPFPLQSSCLSTTLFNKIPQTASALFSGFLPFWPKVIHKILMTAKIKLKSWYCAETGNLKNNDL